MITYSHCAAFTIGATVEGEIVFPGAALAPASLGLGTPHPKTLGYIRSRQLIAAGWKHSANGWEPEDKGAPDQPVVPLRDYPTNLRTKLGDLVRDRREVLIVSARNTLNELNHTARIDGGFYRTGRQAPLDPTTPVLTVRRKAPRTLGFARYGDVEDRGEALDFVSGVVLVNDGRPSSRAEIVASSSDICHNYFASPDNFFGPPDAWLPLSERWNELHTQRLTGEALTAEQFADEMDQVAARVGLPVGAHAVGPVLPHSIAALRNDGLLEFLVWSTSLPVAARRLTSQGYLQAIVLDQSGSVGPTYVDAQGKSRILLSSSNYRDSGTAFIILQTRGFVSPHQHVWRP